MAGTEARPSSLLLWSANVGRAVSSLEIEIGQRDLIKPKADAAYIRICSIADIDLYVLSGKL
jgi:hypothetical protein